MDIFLFVLPSRQTNVVVFLLHHADKAFFPRGIYATNSVSRSKKTVKRQMPKASDPEHQRLREDEAREGNWKRWGPYLAERQWGTVREVK